MPCLDTNYIIAVLRDDPQAVEKIKGLEAAEEKISTSAINLLELYKGIYRSNRPEKTAGLEDFLANITILNIDPAASKTAARITQELGSEGQALSEMDVLIAAAAIANNETLVTRDEHFKRIKQLRIETW